MHQELVERRKWISNARFLHALNYCMLLPGPEAQQLATYVGWLLHRTVGGVVAGSLFVLPSVFILWGLSYVYVVYGNVPWIAAIFYGLKPAVLVLFPEAGKVDVFAVVVAVAAFALMLKWKLDVIPVVVGAGVLGLLYKLLL